MTTDPFASILESGKEIESRGVKIQQQYHTLKKQGLTGDSVDLEFSLECAAAGAVFDGVV